MHSTWKDDWEVERSLNETGQGQAHIVKSKSGRPGKFLLKELKGKNRSEQQARIRIHQEATNLRILNATGAKVPRFVAGNTEKFDDPDALLYFVMEFIEGDLLSNLVQTVGPLPLEEAVWLALDLCATMKTVFNQQLVHRDIKPDNLMVRSRNPADVVVLDFGLSYQTGQDGSPTEAGETMGNSFLILPELGTSHGEKRDVRSDIASIVALLLYCLTKMNIGQLTDGHGKSPREVHAATLTAAITNPVQLNRLNYVLTRGLTADLDQRFQTLGELEARLNDILTPDREAPPEEFKVFKQRAGDQLLRNNPAARLAAYRKKTVQLHLILDTHLDATNREFAGSGFCIYNLQAITRGPFFNSTGGSTGIFNYQVDVGLEAQLESSPWYLIIYSVTEEKLTQCVVHRKVQSEVRRRMTRITTDLPGMAKDIHYFIADIRSGGTSLTLDEDQAFVDAIKSDITAVVHHCVELLSVPPA